MLDCRENMDTHWDSLPNTKPIRINVVANTINDFKNNDASGWGFMLIQAVQ